MTASMEFDTLGWRKQRDAKYREWIRDPAAIAFVTLLGDTAELFDDVVDKDKPVTDAAVARVLFFVLTDLPVNPFFERHKLQLVPLMHMAINAWLDANDLEKGDKTDRARAYVLRDLMIEVVMHTVFLLHGRQRQRELSLEIRQFFLHETFDQYVESSI
jgi:hypothetical protein